MADMQTTRTPAAFNHLGITASDCDAAVQWYTHVFSMQRLGTTKRIPGEFIPPSSLFRRSGRSLKALKVAFIGNQHVALEVVQFIRNDDEVERLPAANLNGEFFHIALTVPSPDDTATAIQSWGGQKLGDVAKLPNGVSFIHCIDPWGNVLELMDGRLHE